MGTDRVLTDSAIEVQAGRDKALGAEWDGDGVNFAVFSGHATRIELCLFDANGQHELARIALPERTSDIWHGYIPGIGPGQCYGYRAHGAHDPEAGHRFNPNKLLLDPYAKEMRGRFSQTDALFGYDPADGVGDLSFSTLDSAPHVPRSVVIDPRPDWRDDRAPNVPWPDTIIYEAHPKGLTKCHPGIAEPERGTFAGLASNAMLDHLNALGVTAIELLPVHAFFDDGFLVDRGLRNYWGYNTIGFFVPEPRYGGAGGIAAFRRMVRRFHAAGIEVILDVVYNHTAEGDHRGPTLCFRGLDNASYYRLQADQPRYYVNDTGCGNTVNVAHPMVLRLVMDSLRYWVETMHVDGFRFDLASTLGREHDGFDPAGGFFDALRQDPVLTNVKLIAEPWDVGPGGYRLGGFPAGFSEWNDAYRDSIRGFWRGEPSLAPGIAAGLLGSAEHFDRAGRRPWSSLNFVTAHDGFTLTDLVSYAHKHNEANGEDNQDGHNDNHSDNCGFEGETNDPRVMARRARRKRNMLATLLLSQGTPMLLGGDELGNSQAGNNNAYCQDNPIGWLDWSRPDEGLIRFVAKLIAFRKAHPCLRQSQFLHGGDRPADGQPDVEWLAPDGQAPNWHDPKLRCFCLLVRGYATAPVYDQIADAVFMVFNEAYQKIIIRMPATGDGHLWRRTVDTSQPNAPERNFAPGRPYLFPTRSVVVFALTAGGRNGNR